MINLLKKIFVILNGFCFILFNLLLHPLNYNETVRRIILKITGKFWYNICFYLLNNKITFISKPKIKNNDINIINANHSFQIDYLIINYIFCLYKIKPYQIRSFSTNVNISFLDKVILKLINACMINSKDYRNSIINSIKRWSKRPYAKFVIMFFEGVTNSDLKNNKQLILKPKKLGFNIIMKNIPKKNKYLTDINIVYSKNGKVYDGTNKQLIYDLLLGNKVKIYVEINNYLLPDKNYSEWLDKLYVKKENKIKNIISKLK